MPSPEAGGRLVIGGLFAAAAGVPALYRLRLGVWSPDTGRKWRVWRGGWPTARHLTEIGALTVEPATSAEPTDER